MLLILNIFLDFIESDEGYTAFFSFFLKIRLTQAQICVHRGLSLHSVVTQVERIILTKITKDEDL